MRGRSRARRSRSRPAAGVVSAGLHRCARVVDLAAMRDAIAADGRRPGEDPNPLAPAELVIDHSVQVDAFGTRDSFRFNAEREFASATRSATRSCAGGRAPSMTSRWFPRIPGSCTRSTSSTWRGLCSTTSRPDSSTRTRLVGDRLAHDDGQRPRRCSAGAWVGSEAEAAMLGQPLSMLIPRVVGFELHGELPRARRRRTWC